MKGQTADAVLQDRSVLPISTKSEFKSTINFTGVEETMKNLLLRVDKQGKMK